MIPFILTSTPLSTSFYLEIIQYERNKIHEETGEL